MIFRKLKNFIFLQKIKNFFAKISKNFFKKFENPKFPKFEKFKHTFAITQKFQKQRVRLRDEKVFVFGLGQTF